MTPSTPTSTRRSIAGAMKRMLLPLAALAGLVALSGCYYGPYYPYGYYGYPGYAYAAPPVVGGVVIRGGYGYRGYWR